MRLSIATAPKKNSRHWKNHAVEWGEILDWMRDPADVKECGNYLLGELADTTVTHTGDRSSCTGSHRRADAVRARSAVTLDADYLHSAGLSGDDFLAGVAALGWEAIVHTTYSSTEQAPRYRVILPLDEPVAPDDYRVLARHLMVRLGEAAFDPGSTQPERYMFKPSAQAGQTFHWKHFVGHWLPVAMTLLDASLEDDLSGPDAESEPSGAPPGQWRTPPTARELEKAATTLAKAERCAPELLYPTKKALSAGPTAPGRNEWLAAWLRPLYGFVLGDCLDRDDVDSTMWRAAQTAPLPQAGDEFTRQEFDTVCASVWATSKATRPDVEEADQVFTPVPLPDATTVVARPDLYVDKRDGLLAKRLADDVAKHAQIAVGALDERFYLYDDGVWRPGGKEVGTLVSLLLGDKYRRSHLTTVQDKLRYDPSTRTLDCGPTPKWINCRNGLLDWKTRELADHTPDVPSVVQLPVAWNPDAECPRFEKFVRQVLPADCIEPSEGGAGFIWELLGYCVYSGNPHHIAVLLRGKGRNGKGALLRVIERLLGSHNVSAVTLHDLTENRFRTADLYGKIANIAGDLDPKWLDNTARFKAITGGDLISAEHKYGQAFGFTPWALPLYSANKEFGSADSSAGYFARWVVVPFPNSFLGREDRALDARLGTRSELEGILRRAVEALPRLMERGRLPEPGSVQEAKKSFIRGGDQVRAWVDEYCALEPDAWTPRTDLHHHYQVKSDRRSELSKREFYNRIDQIDGIRQGKRQGIVGFHGIGIRPIRYVSNEELGLPPDEDDLSTLP